MTSTVCESISKINFESMFICKNSKNFKLSRLRKLLSRGNMKNTHRHLLCMQNLSMRGCYKIKFDDHEFH